MKNNWITKKFDELGNILIGGTPSRNNHLFWSEENTGFPWVSIADLSKSGKIINKTKESITKLGINASNVKIISKGSIIFSFKLSVGKKAIAGKELFTNEAIAAFQFKDEFVDNDYLYYGLDNVDYSKVTDSAIKGVTLNKEKLKKLTIDLPPLPQQKKIAKILSTVDTVIERTETAIAKYQAIKQGLMHDLFTRGIDVNTGKLRPTPKDAPELYKEGELGLIPKVWEIATIQEFASQNNYAIVDGPFGSNLKTIHYRTKGYRIIQSGFVTSNEFIANKYLFVEKEKYYSEIRSSVKAGDIIMAKIGAQCGTCAILPDNHPDSIIAGNCLKITVDKNNNSNFLLNILHLYRKIGKLDLIISTTAQPAISMASLKVMNIPYPKLEEQNLISEKLNSLKNKIQVEKKSLTKYQQLKVGLMQDLLTGKVEVKTS